VDDTTFVQSLYPVKHREKVFRQPLPHTVFIGFEPLFGHGRSKGRARHVLHDDVFEGDVPAVFHDLRRAMIENLENVGMMYLRHDLNFTAKPLK
jgi:hypothetical protein